MKSIKNTILGGLAALAISAAPGCSVQRHYVTDKFDNSYHCEINFSEDFKSDLINLYENNNLVATRKHAVKENKHQALYEFFNGNKRIAYTLGGKNPLLFDIDINKANSKFVLPLQRVLVLSYEMHQCEKLLQEKTN